MLAEAPSFVCLFVKWGLLAKTERNPQKAPFLLVLHQWLKGFVFGFYLKPELLPGEKK